jgi:predicted O-methyltransferase YrrM
MIGLPLLTHKESEVWGDYEAFNSGSVEKEVGELLYSFARILKPHHILDLGTHKGISAAYLGLACRDNNVGLVDTVEYDKSHWDEAKRLWDKISLEDYIFQYKCSVDEFINDEVMYDLILIDTEPAQRWQELDRFYAQLNPGGYVFIHDLPRQFCVGNINSDHPEIKNWPFGEIPDRIQQLMKDRLLVPFHLPNPRSMCGFYKARSDDYEIC